MRRAAARCSIAVVVLFAAPPAPAVLGFRPELSDDPSAAVEVAANEALVKPDFDPARFSTMLSPFVDLPVGPCGSRILSTMWVNEDMKARLLKSTKDFFSVQTVNGKRVLVAVGDGWAALDPSLRGAMPVQDGHPLEWSPSGASLDTVRTLLAPAEGEPGTPVNFTFDVGVDLRGCWADIRDLAGHPVCGPYAMRGLASGMEEVSPVLDASGQSGATIITNVDGFIIKSMKDADEYELLHKVMVKIHANIEKRFPQSCYASALAPICLAFRLPTPQGDVQWLAMRKIEIPGRKRARMYLDGHRVKEIDIKGPKFANSLRDGKSFFSKSSVWMKKDSGFAKMFPYGIKLRGCGSRDAAFTLASDAKLLADTDLTDYSLYGKFYAARSDAEYKCACEASGHPTFPLILDTQNHGLSGPLTIAVGVIDYIEDDVSTVEQWSVLKLFSMSTMKKPHEFKAWWMRMWPNYFHLPARRWNMAAGLIEADDHAPAERMHLGQRVHALMKIKWRGGGNMEERVIDGATHEVYGVQIPELTAEPTSANSKYKVSAGAHGTVAAFNPESIVVRWDKFKGSGKLHVAFPDQIIGWPPDFVPAD